MSKNYSNGAHLYPMPIKTIGQVLFLINVYEGYYASIVYAYLASLGLELIPEDTTNKGRIDLTVKMGNRIYIIEFKVDGEGKALQQIKDMNYAQKYQNTGKEIYLIGIDFDSSQRNISGFEWEMG